MGRRSSRDYLRGRPSLMRAFVLIDGRRGIKDSDEATMTALDKSAVSYADRADQARRGEDGRPGRRSSPRRSKPCASGPPPTRTCSSPRPAPAKASRSCAPMSRSCWPSAACRRDRRSRPARKALVAAISTPLEKRGQRPRLQRRRTKSHRRPVFCAVPAAAPFRSQGRPSYICPKAATRGQRVLGRRTSLRGVGGARRRMR